MRSYPDWLHILSICSLLIAAVCALLILVDELRRPQRMWVMNLVWPLCALFGGLLWLAGYWIWGREPRRRTSDGDPDTPMVLAVAKGTSHCGAGCVCGDVIAEWLCFALPGIAVAFGWGAIFKDKTFAVWVLDFLLAFLFGIGFQYFAIAPMRHLGLREGLLQALKADTLSISAWQVGMYGFMALAQFAWLRPAFGRAAEVDTPEFWLIMQLAMLAGFVTAYPVNWLLIRAGVKEKM